MEKREMVCIACPIGCKLTVSGEGNQYWVKGNQCPRGESYGIKEMTNPTRMLTSTVIIENCHLKRLPVKTSAPIPKEQIFSCMRLLDDLVIEGPVNIGDVILENVLNTGVNVQASRSM